MTEGVFNLHTQAHCQWHGPHCQCRPECSRRYDNWLLFSQTPDSELGIHFTGKLKTTTALAQTRMIQHWQPEAVNFKLTPSNPTRTQSGSLSTGTLSVQASFFALVALVFLSGDQQPELTATFLGDHWLPSGSGCWCANAAVSPGERQGLVNLYLATDGPGPNWQGVTGWSNYADPAADPCSWTGVGCDGSSIKYVVTASDGTVPTVTAFALLCFAFIAFPSETHT